MTIFNAPHMPRIPEGATKEDRMRMFEDYKRQLRLANPHLCHSDGTERSMFSWLGRLFGRKSP